MLHLIADIVIYTKSPVFLNNFECFDKKLHKNVIKRCGVEPLL